MSKCRWCGKATSGYKIYCDNDCMQNYRYNIERGEKGIIGKLSRHGAKILAVRVIKQAVSDKDFRWICSKNSDLFFDLAGVTKEEIMNCFDDNLNLIRKKEYSNTRKFELPPEYGCKTLVELAEKYDIPVRILYNRINEQGLSVEQALRKPLKKN